MLGRGVLLAAYALLLQQLQTRQGSGWGGEALRVAAGAPQPASCTNNARAAVKGANDALAVGPAAGRALVRATGCSVCAAPPARSAV